MPRNGSGWTGASARLLLLAGAVCLTGCETWTEGMTLPSGHYLEHPPQNIPPSPSFPLTRELASQEATAVASGAPEAAAAAPGELEEALREHAEALAALKVATRALEASQKRLEALAKKGSAVAPAGAPGTPTSPSALPPPTAAPVGPSALPGGRGAAMPASNDAPLMPAASDAGQEALSAPNQEPDHIDWVAYYKNHGYQVSGGCGPGGCPGCGRINYAPVTVAPNMQWAAPGGPPAPAR